MCRTRKWHGWWLRASPLDLEAGAGGGEWRIASQELIQTHWSRKAATPPNAAGGQPRGAANRY